MDDFTRALMQLLAYLKEKEEHRLEEFRQMFGPRTFIDGMRFERRRQGELFRSIVSAFGTGMAATLLLVVVMVLMGKALGAHMTL